MSGLLWLEIGLVIGVAGGAGVILFAYWPQIRSTPTQPTKDDPDNADPPGYL